MRMITIFVKVRTLLILFIAVPLVPGAWHMIGAQYTFIE